MAWSTKPFSSYYLLTALNHLLAHFSAEPHSIESHRIRRTLISHVPTTPTIVTYKSKQAVSGAMAQLFAVSTQGRLHKRWQRSRTASRHWQITVACNVTYLIADVTYRTVLTVSSKVPRLTAIVTRFLVLAICRKVSRPMTILT